MSADTDMAADIDNGRGPQPPAYPKARRRFWWLFQSGLESFNMPILIVFAPYFASQVIGDREAGQVLWGYAAGTGAAIAAISAPALALMAENPARRRWLMLVALLLNALPAFALYWLVPGAQGLALMMGLIAFGMCVAANDWLYVFHGSMLRDVAPGPAMGKTSGVGYSYAWFAALLIIGAFQALFMGTDAQETGALAERLIGPLTGVLLLAFGLPLLVLPPPERAAPPQRSLSQWFSEEWASLMAEKTVAYAILVRFVYWIGVAIVITFGSQFSAGVFGWDTGTATTFGLAILIPSIIGATLGGVIDDVFGSRNALILVLTGLALSLIVLLSVSPDRVAWIFAFEPRAADAPMLSSGAERATLVIALFMGLFLGPVGSIGRTLIARLAPPERSTRYFGFASLAGNSTSALGPLAVAVLTNATDSTRWGLAIAPIAILAGVVLAFRLPRAHGRDMR